jgi:hypothetical protein
MAKLRTARVVLLALPLVLYCALPTRNFYWDGVAFAINIEKRLPAAALLYPSHLIYMLWGSWLYRLCDALGIHTRALFVMQVSNGTLGGLCVFLLDKGLRRRNLSAGLSAAAALLFAFSATWWKFASDANAYIPAIFFLLCAWLLLDNPRTVLLAGLAHAVAMLFHQLAIVFLPVALLGLKKRRPAYSAAALVPVVAAYAVSYRATAVHATLSGFFAWVTWHAPDSSFSFHPVTNFLLSLRGTARLFFGGKVGDFAGDGISQAALVLLAIASVAFLAGAWRTVRQTKLARPPFPLLVWAGAYAIFLFFWMPQNTFYRLFYLPPLVAILATTLRGADRAVRLFVPVLLLWNFAFAIYPQSRVDRNAPLSFAMAQRERWPAGTPIVFSLFHPDLWTISYFNMQAAWIGMPEPDIARLQHQLDEARSDGKPLWVEQTTWDRIASSPAGRDWLAAHEQPLDLVRFTDPKHEFRFHCLR